MKTQALDFDAIAGATVSSEAFLAAVADCVRQAGADPTLLVGAELAPQQVEYATEADVIVIGAGGAGLTAAVTAAEEGARVIVLEKSGTVGGNFLMTMNGINAVDSSIQLADANYVAEAPAGGFKDLTVAMNEASTADYPEAELADEAMLDAYVANSGELIDWLAGKGLEFTVTFSEDPRNGTTNYWLLMGGDNFETAPKVIGVLDEERKGLDAVNLYLNTEATAISVDDAGAVTGVVATTPEGEKTFMAPSVIICTGGFNADMDKVAELRPDLANAVVGVRAPTTGDGLAMAEELGADTINLDVMNTFPNFMVGYGLVLAWLLPGGETLDCIYVDQDAKRFTAEGFMVANALLENQKSFTIFDESGLSDELRTAIALPARSSRPTPSRGSPSSWASTQPRLPPPSWRSTRISPTGSMTSSAVNTPVPTRCSLHSMDTSSAWAPTTIWAAWSPPPQHRPPGGRETTTWVR